MYRISGFVRDREKDKSRTDETYRTPKDKFKELIPTIEETQSMKSLDEDLLVENREGERVKGDSCI